MLTGKLPFSGATTQETMLLRLTDQPATLDQLLPGVAVGPAVQAAISRALSRQPADRFPDIAHFAEALRASGASAGEPATEILPRVAPQPARSRPGAPPPAGPPTRTYLRWGLAATTLIAVAWLATARPWQPDPAGVASPPPSAEPPAPASLPATPPPAPPAATPSSPGVAVPPLPTERAVFSTDSAVRRGARQQAELVYRSDAAADSVRALAAYFVAEVFIREGLYSTAREWLNLCLALGERKLCRDLLLALP
jgi:serine/threonine-protein kinase